MEATKERESAGLLDKILPPRLEDAGLEDCALPPDSIHEAFLKAASAVKSRAATIFHSDDDEDEVKPGCLDDPFPDKGKCSSDVLVWPPCPDVPDVVVVGGPSDPASESVEGCVKEKECGRELVEGKDMVVVGSDGAEAVDGKGCLDDELKGLKIGEKEKKEKENVEEEEEERGKQKPILVEGFVIFRSHPNWETIREVVNRSIEHLQQYKQAKY